MVGLIGIFVYMKSSGILNYMSSAEEFKKYIEGYGKKAIQCFFYCSVHIRYYCSNTQQCKFSGRWGGSIWHVGGFIFFISILAILSGSTVVFILGRRFGRTFAEQFINPKLLNKYEQHFSSKKGGELLLILLLFLPFFPDDAIGLQQDLVR